MLVYGTDTATDRCNIFETLVPEWKYPKLQKYMLRDIDLQQRDRSQWDQSLSYCNGVIKKSFQPEFFKLGDPTPGQANDCSGTHFIVDNRLELKGLSVLQRVIQKGCQRLCMKIQNLRKCAQLAFPLLLFFIAKIMIITKMM